MAFSRAKSSLPLLSRGSLDTATILRGTAPEDRDLAHIFPNIRVSSAGSPPTNATKSFPATNATASLTPSAWSKAFSTEPNSIRRPRSFTCWSRRLLFSRAPRPAGEAARSSYRIGFGGKRLAPRRRRQGGRCIRGRKRFSGVRRRRSRAGHTDVGEDMRQIPVFRRGASQDRRGVQAAPAQQWQAGFGPAEGHGGRARVAILRRDRTL